MPIVYIRHGVLVVKVIECTFIPLTYKLQANHTRQYLISDYSLTNQRGHLEELS